MRRASLLLPMAAAACVGTAPAPRQSEAMERSARILAALDHLEADLHSRDAEMATYSELIERHQQTQQIACSVTDEHVLDIARLAAVQEARMAQKAGVAPKKRKTVAVRARSPRRTHVDPANG
jgi:hypothetical protein